MLTYCKYKMLCLRKQERKLKFGFNLPHRAERCLRYDACTIPTVAQSWYTREPSWNGEIQMRGEIRRLLECIEEEHVALQCVAQTLVGDARYKYVQEKNYNIGEAYSRLLELCGEKAHGYVSWAIQWADLSEQVDQARSRIRRRIYEYQVEQMQTKPMRSIQRRIA